MAITRASGQGGGVLGNSVTFVTRAFPNNVATDSLVIGMVSHYNPLLTDLNAGPFQSAGTATLGTWQQHAVRRATLGAGSNVVGLTIFSAPVTAGGSLTLRYDNGSGGQFMTFATDELVGADLTSTRGYTGVGADTGASSSTATDSGNIASTEGGVFLGSMAYDGSAGDTTITEDGAFSLIYEYESWAAMTGSHILRIVTGATTDSASWTLGASRPWAAVATFIKAAPDAAPATAFQPNAF